MSLPLLTVVFLKDTNWASGVMRGDIVASYLNEYARVSARSVPVVDFLRETPAPLTHCVCVKCNVWQNTSQLIDVCHARGGQFVWDPLDHPQTLQMIQRYADVVDGWFVSNEYVAAVARGHGAQQVRVLRHPHSNFANVTRDCRAPVRTVGFTASVQNRPGVDDWALLTSALRARGLDLRFLPTQALATDKPKWGQAAAHAIPDEIGLALIWPPSMDDFTLNWRPNTRLTHWWSHGIPVAYFPYMSYLFAAGPVGLVNSSACRSPTECAALLGALAKNADRRCAHARRVLEAAEDYSYASVVREYILYMA